MLIISVNNINTLYICVTTDILNFHINIIEEYYYVQDNNYIC